MESKQLIVGLDLGTHSLKMAIGTCSREGEVHLLRLSKIITSGMMHASIGHPEQTVAAIRKSLKGLPSDIKTKDVQIHVNVGSRRMKTQVHHIITSLGKNTSVTKKHVESLYQEIYQKTANPKYTIIDIIPKEYIVDRERNIQHPVGMVGNYLEGIFYVLCTPTNVVHNIYRCIQQTSLTPGKFISNACAASKAVLQAQEKEAGICLVDIGASMTSIAIYYNGILQHTAGIPFGGDAITKDIAHAFMLPKPTAEKLKCCFGMAYEDPDRHEVVHIPGLARQPMKTIHLALLDRVIEARLMEMLRYLRQEIKKAHCQHKLAGGIVLTGGTAQLEALDKLCAYLTAYSVRLGHPREKVTSDNNTLQQPNLEYAAAIGLLASKPSKMTLPFEAKYGTKTIPQNTKQKRSKPSPNQLNKGIFGFFKRIFS